MNFFRHPTVFIRHGETEWNLQKKTQGRLDSPLTERGMQQARVAAYKLRDRSFNLIVSSPLGRAIETAKIIQNELDLDIELHKHPDLAERNFGILEGKVKDILMDEFPHFWDAEGHFLHESEPQDGEPLQEFFTRIQRAVEYIRTISKEKSVIVVTHDGVLHAIAACLKRIKLSHVQRVYRFLPGEPIVFE